MAYILNELVIPLRQAMFPSRVIYYVTQSPALGM